MPFNEPVAGLATVQTYSEKAYKVFAKMTEVLRGCRFIKESKIKACRMGTLARRDVDVGQEWPTYE